MKTLLDLGALGSRIAVVDGMIIQLVAQRLMLAEQVGAYKRAKGEDIFRAEVEDRRIAAIRQIAEELGLNPHFAETLLYLLIGESCKLQMVRLQEAARLPAEPQTEDEWYAKLKHNLLYLAERYSASYDAEYGKGCTATHAYLAYEEELLAREIGKLSDYSLLVDLGCATGRVALRWHGGFDRVIGYDISQHMQSQASRLVEERNLQERVSFERVDLEDGIPLPDESASFVVMSLGTGSDLRDIRRVIADTFRVLKTGGRFFFSFYNRDALVYRWEFLPWQAGLAAIINIHNDSLDVRLNADGHEERVSVFARAYTKGEAEALFAPCAVDLVTYPALSAVLPNEIFSAQGGARAALADADRRLTDTDMGAYIIVTGQKE